MKTIHRTNHPIVIKAYKTPKEMTELYRFGSSCMTIEEFGANDIEEIILKEHKIWKTSMFSYVPGVLGLGIFSGKRMIGRCLIQRKKRFGSVYIDVDADDPYNTVDLCTDVLNKFGYKYGTLSVTARGFKIPGLKHEGRYYMPFAYIDSGIRCFDVSFSRKTKEFTVVPGSKFSANAVATQGGWISNEDARVHKKA